MSDSFSGTDTGRQRRHNEDSLYARAPLFVVADGMGGAQAGEVASHTAIESFQRGLEDSGSPEEMLAARVREANARIHELAQGNADLTGMGTTITAVYAGPEEVVIAHVGDSRAYCLRNGELLRLTDDHSLVDELMRQGKLTPEEAEDHPQRSIITRALGPEPAVDVDTRTARARDGDTYLLCSDGLTTMVPEARVAEILRSYAALRDAGTALLAAANEAGGRDNITVVLFRLQEVGEVGPVVGGDSSADQPTLVGEAPAPATAPLAPIGEAGTGRERRAPQPARDRPDAGQRSHRASGPHRRRAWLVPSALALFLLAAVITGLYIATTAVYFVGTDARGFVTEFSGLPYVLPGSLRLYSQYYVSGIPAATIAPARRKTLLDHALRSRRDASDLMRRLELGQIAGT